MGDYVLCLPTIMKQTLRDAQDAEWNGEPSQHLYARYDHLKSLHDAGDDWYPTF